MSWMDLGRYSSEERPAPSGAGPDIICRRSAFLPWTCDGFRSSVHSGVTGPQQNYGPATQIPPTGDDAISLSLGLLQSSPKKRQNNRIFALSRSPTLTKASFRRAGLQKSTAAKLRCHSSVCGETEIRTRDTLLEYTRFPGVPLKPLEHLSRLKSRKNGTAKIRTF